MTRRIAPAPAGVPALEPVRQDLYDTKLQDGTVSTLEFFRNPGIAGLAELATNMQANGQLPYPQQFHVFGLNLELVPYFPEEAQTGVDEAHWQNKKKVLETAFFRFHIGSKTYLIDPAKRIPASLGPVGFGTGAQAGINAFPTNGLQDIQHYYDVTIRQGGKIKPIHIPAQQSFYVQVVWPFGNPAVEGGGWEVRAYLVGILWREVQ